MVSFHPERGVEFLKKQLLQRYGQVPEEFYALETRFIQNQKDGRLCGDNDPSVRADFNRVTYDLNRFTLEHLHMSYNDLCRLQDSSIFLSQNGQQLVKERQTSGQMKVLSERLGTRKRWAILVGAGKYQDERYHELPLCIEDVTEVARQLHSNASGFSPDSIRILVDDAPPQYEPTRQNILSALRDIAAATEPDDLLLFYYTGHGDFKQDESFLVTQNGMLDSLEDTALAISQVKTIMQGARARAKVIILDACHAGADLSSKGSRRMPAKFIERVFMQAKGMVILSSCEKNQLSYAWEKRKRSVFTYFLLEALQGKADYDDKGFVSVDDIHRYVTNGLAAWSESKGYTQTPTKNTEESGEIVVCYYDLPSNEPPASPTPLEKTKRPEQKQSLHKFVPSPSWASVDTINIGINEYMLYKTTIQEEQTRDSSAIYRCAKAQNLTTNQIVWLKQVHIFHLTQQARTCLDLIIKEHRLAILLQQYRDFPHLLSQDGINSEPVVPDTTILYDAWTGSTLKEVFSSQPLDRVLIAPLVQKILSLCQTLSILHKKGYSHRNLNLDNIILLDGSERRTVLQDFGFAARRTRPGKEAAHFAAPEQRRNELDLGIPGPQTDIYQLGAILYLLITGQQPSSVTSVSYNPAVFPALDHIIMRAIATAPRDRWPDMLTFGRELKKVL